MLYTEKLLAALESKKAKLKGHDDSLTEHISTYRKALHSISEKYPDALSIVRKLPTNTPIGAQPTPEYDTWASSAQPGDLPVIPFDHVFGHHQESRAWAQEAIHDVTTVAVDGSQLLPWRDASVPVALIQVGYFENPHHGDKKYIKDARVEVLLPEDLTTTSPNGASSDEKQMASDRFAYSDQVVHLRRLELEVQTLIQRIEQAEDPSHLLVFYDGSLIVSFALTMQREYRERYVKAVTDLIHASEQYKVPLLAYIDTSYARDVSTMLHHLYPDLGETDQIHDGLLWRGKLRWGDRTPAFISGRGDVLESYGEYRDAVGFIYLQTTLKHNPVRVEFPLWMLNAGVLERSLDILRAEIIAGNGYPYAIETADATAVISVGDREKFYALFQQFADRQGVQMTFSSKAVSKIHRRV